MRELIINIIQRNQKELILGGRHHLYYRLLDDFFEKLTSTDIGVKLVFFGSSAVMRDTVLEKCNSMNHAHQNTIKILERIDHRGNINENPHESIRSRLAIDEKRVARDHGELFVFMQAIVEEEMVRYARNNKNVVAILGHHNDFLLYNMNDVEYWRSDVSQLDCHNFKTTAFNKTHALAKMDLTSHQYQCMIAVLAANQIHKFNGQLVTPEPNTQKLEPSFDSKAQRQMYNIFDAVKTYCPAEYQNTDFHSLSSTMFRENCNKNLYAETIKTQYENYNHIGNVAQILPFAELPEEDEILQILSKNNNLYCAYVDWPMIFDSNFIDSSQWNWNPNAKTLIDLLVSMLKKMIGIVLYGKRDEPTIRKLFVKRTNGATSRMESVAAEFPPCAYQIE